MKFSIFYNANIGGKTYGKKNVSERFSDFAVVPMRT